MVKLIFFFLCGDFSARCSDLDDYIIGINSVSGREVLDFHVNKYGSLMPDFLIDSNCCILNRRNHIGNNFTFVGPQGCSVVVYCLVPYEYLGWFKNSNVKFVADLITDLSFSENVGHSTAKPDHSILSWDFQLRTYKVMPETSNCGGRNFTVFDISCVPQNFLGE